ncbi:MAG: TIGR02301 family protein [Bauldia sp.]|nr:TIGR02301 family protein [Bauldia sp.]
MRRSRTAALLVAATLAVAGPAAAQDKPYAEQLGRLAEILGSLHYLAGLCDPGPSPYRGQMTALLDAEAPEAAFRAQLVDRFNLGFSSFAAVHRQCTPAAREAIVLYRADGAALAADIAVQYGTPVPQTPPNAVPPPAGG